MRPTPAGRGGTARCCSPYNAILERLDTMDVRIQQAVDDANAAMSAAVIQAGNAAQSASDALTQAGIAAGKASDAAADAADAAQDAADAAQALSDINDTIQTTLDNELGGKVDKLTTAGLHLYSHTGATQGEEEPIDGTTANSIPIRDGNGRMHAADPASGATDKTLVTANWVSQTGSGAPNNLMHKSGDETATGTKTWDVMIANRFDIAYKMRRGKTWLYSNNKRYLRAFRYTTNAGVMIRLNVIWGFNTPSRYGMADVIISDCGICKADYKGTATFSPAGLYVCKGTDGYTYFIISNIAGYNGVTIEISNATRYSQNDDIPGFEMLTESAFNTEPAVGDTYTDVFQGTSI